MTVRLLFALLLCVTLVATQTSFVTNVGMHQFGGTLQTSYTTADTCLSACMSSSTCFAADFNSATNECYFHNRTTACSTLNTKADCNNFQLATCIAGMNIFGGVQQTALTTPSACITNCRNNSATCLAADFNSADNTCWFHNSTLACGTLNAKSTCTNFKITNTCAGYNTTSTNEAYTGTHILGGVSQGTSTLSACITGCNALTTCLGVDFNSSDMLCYYHNSTTACSSLRSKTACTHIRLTTTCSSTTTTATTLPP